MKLNVVCVCVCVCTGCGGMYVWWYVCGGVWWYVYVVWCLVWCGGMHVWCGGMQFPLFLFEVSFRCILRLPSQLLSTQRRKRGIALQFISQGKHAFSHDSSRPTRRQENRFTRTVSDITWLAPLPNYQVLVSVRVVLDNGGATAGLRAVSRDGITGVSPGIGDTKRK